MCFERVATCVSDISNFGAFSRCFVLIREQNIKHRTLNNLNKPCKSNIIKMPHQNISGYVTRHAFMFQNQFSSDRWMTESIVHTHTQCLLEFLGWACQKMSVLDILQNMWKKTTQHNNTTQAKWRSSHLLNYNTMLKWNTAGISLINRKVLEMFKKQHLLENNTFGVKGALNN